jgi:N6-L-threonylcarbamoyladenine synthase
VDKRALILGIESSCDETAAALVRGGDELVSSVVASQIATHSPYGGVVPELASREHLRNLVPVTRAALAKARLTYADIDAVAVTNGPGLAGALLTGVSFAKSLAWALEKPLIAVNHIEGHIHAVLLERRYAGLRAGYGPTDGPPVADAGLRAGYGPTDGPPVADAGALEFPVLALVVSGGHTHLFLAKQRGHGWHYENIGHTRDDAAGEAFDKTAKLLGLGYPGGPIIDRISKFGDPKAVKFTFAQLKHQARNESKRAGRMELDRKRFDFSYSGIKTAVLRYVETHDMFGAIAARRQALLQIAAPGDEDFKRLCDRQTLDLVASFQAAVVSDLTQRTMAACEEYGVQTLLVTGGVAANSALRVSLEQRGPRSGVQVHFPSRVMSTDNAAMIAAAAYSKWLSREFAGLDVSAEANLELR